MGHLGMTIPEALLSLAAISLLLWAPVFGFAYARRGFGGRARNYALAWVAAAGATVAGFVLLALIEAAGR